MQFKAVLLNLFLIFTTLISQPAWDLPENIQVLVNDSTLQVDAERRQRILEKAAQGKLNYSIAGIHFDGDRIYTKLLIPQTFSKWQVIEQVILYYAFLSNERDRKREQVFVYPLFVDTETQPHMEIRYTGNGKFAVKVKQWQTVVMPERPTIFEAEIYNQILDRAFTREQAMETIPDEIFSTVARNHKTEIEVIRDIYQKVHLWQKSQ